MAEQSFRVAEILQLLRSEQSEVREAGLQQILNHSAGGELVTDEFREELISMVLSSERSEPEQEMATMSLGHLQQAPSLETFAKSDDPRVRSHAAAGYGYCSTEKSIYCLLDLLTDSVNTVRNMAERSLIRQMELVRTMGIEGLLQLLDHPAPLTHSPAARILGLSGDQRALQPLLHCASTGEKWLTRMWATKALGDLGCLEAYDELKRRLQTDEKNRVRATAAVALGELRHPQSREALEAAKSDEDEGVQTAIEEALDALSQSGEAETIDPFAESEST